jgi:putative Holliday junction resolvase
MRIMGIDYGTKRIGVAVSDPSGTMAHPLDIVPVREDGSHIEALKKIALDYQVEKLVVGLPYNMEGDVGVSAQKVMLWAEELGRALNLPVDLWDERLTTAEAHELLMHLKVKGPRRRQIVDKIAASIILKSYLDARQP